MKRIVLAVIRFYQRLKFLFLTGQCRFTPRCSEYTYQAIEAYGIIHGLWLGVKRIVRCHPWSKGGEDPVPL